MAVKPLDQRLDDLNQAVADTAQRSDLAASVDPNPLLPELPLTDDQLREQDVQVAGPASFIKKIIKGVEKVEPRKPPEPVLTEEARKALEIQDLQRANDVTQTGTRQEIGIAGRVEQAAQPAMTPQAVMQEAAKVKATPEALTAKPPEAAFNLPLMSGDDDIRATIQAIDNLNPAKPAKITFEEVKQKAIESGVGVQFIDDLLARNLAVNPENTYKALNAVVWAGKRIDELAQKVADGSATPTELAEMSQTIHFSNLLQQEVKGYQTNIAQSLAVMRMPRTGIEDISNILVNMGSETDVTKFAQAYLKLKDPKAKADLIQGLARGTPWEKLFGIYVNGLLSRPTTHIKNFLSSTIFIPYRLTERAIAAGVGAGRRAVGLGSEDAYVMSEVPAILASTPMAIRNGFQLAVEAWSTGVPKNWTDPVKIARQQSRMELINYRADGSLMSAAIKGLNFVTTLPGRSLLTADEFFKGINYTHELTAEATRLATKTFDDAVKGGASVADAEKLADDTVAKFLDNPPESIMQLSEVGTFTQKLEGPFAKLQESLNPSSPMSLLMRMQIPFISTPVNIMGEVVQRTPLGVFSKNLWADLAKGGTKESDIAITKIGLGTAAISGFASLASEGTITGSGPAEKGTREAMMRQGWQPYSFVLDVGDNREAFNSFGGMARFGTGEYEGKVFISYQGLEPVGALLAIGADYSDFAKYEADDSRINAYAGGAAFGIANYMMEHPFMQGVDNIFQLVGTFASGDKNRFVDGINKLSEMLTTSARKALTPLSGAITSVKEKFDPLARDYTPDPSAPAGLQGLMKALNQFRGETPGLSESLPPKLNIWGEASEHEYAWAPFRLKQGKAREVDIGLIQLNVNQAMPGREASAVDPGTGISASVKLNTEEYNEMLRIANNELNLENRILSLVKEAERVSGQVPVIHLQNTIKGEFEKVFSDARKILISRSPELQSRLSEQAQRLEEFGRGAK